MTKSIKIATGLIRRIELSSERANAIKVWEILKEHRAMLIDRMLQGLATYVDYKHPGRPVKKEQLNRITDHLIKLKDLPSLERYGSVVDAVLTSNREVSHIETEPFLIEINEIIDEGLTMVVAR